MRIESRDKRGALHIHGPSRVPHADVAFRTPGDVRSFGASRASSLSVKKTIYRPESDVKIEIGECSKKNVYFALRDLHTILPILDVNLCTLYCTLKKSCKKKTTDIIYIFLRKILP